MTPNRTTPSRMMLGRTTLGRRAMIGASATAAIVPARRSRAKSDADPPVRIGMLTDMSGFYSDVTGAVVEEDFPAVCRDTIREHLDAIAAAVQVPCGRLT